MADFRSLLVPKERPCRLYLNQHDGFRLGVAMGFEKGLHVKRDRSLFRKRVDVGSDRSLAFVFSGSAAVAAAADPARVRRGGTRANPVIEN